jgi:GST-like protein
LIDLYSAATGNGRRALLALEESALPYTLHRIEVGKDAHKPPAFLELNPLGTIPLIVDPQGPGGQRVVLRQSAAIVFYVAEKSGRLLPRDGPARAAALEWMMFAMTDIVGANTAMYQTLTEFPQAEAPAAWFRERLIEFLRTCDRRLRESDYIAGSEMTVADVALFPVLVSRRAIVDAAPGLEHFKRWGERIGERPAIQRALAKETAP